MYDALINRLQGIIWEIYCSRDLCIEGMQFSFAQELELVLDVFIHTICHV